MWTYAFVDDARDTVDEIEAVTLIRHFCLYLEVPSKAAEGISAIDLMFAHVQAKHTDGKRLPILKLCMINVVTLIGSMTL